MTDAFALKLVDVGSGYGPTRIVDDVSLTLGAGEGLALIGRNGAGKTTLVNTIAGRVAQQSGMILLNEKRIDALGPAERCRRGIGFVPQDRQIFRTLTVEENLQIADLNRGMTLERIYGFFPRLAERKRNMGGQLSGGEQQMLAIGRALMGNPRLILLDEPFEGLAPVIVDGLFDALVRLRTETALAMIVVEQHARLALEMSDRGLLIERGRVRLQGSRSDLFGRWQEVETLLSV